MENEGNGKELYVPANCPPLDYIVEGFTSMDIAGVVICTFIGAFIAVYVGIVSGNLIKAVFIVLGMAGIAVLFLHRDRYGENCIDKILIEVEYYRTEKEYLYDYVDVYEHLYTTSKLGEKNERRN